MPTSKHCETTKRLTGSETRAVRKLVELRVFRVLRESRPTALSRIETSGIVQERCQILDIPLFIPGALVTGGPQELWARR